MCSLLDDHQWLAPAREDAGVRVCVPAHRRPLRRRWRPGVSERPSPHVLARATVGRRGIVVRMATELDVAVLVGLQASGKSTFYARCLSGQYALVSKDLFPPRARNKQRRQMRALAEHLEAARPVAVDNTNPTPAEWGPLVDAAHKHGATATAYWFRPDLAGSLCRNAAREGRERVPDIGVLATAKRLRAPCTADGFDAVREVRFDGRGGFEVRG